MDGITQASNLITSVSNIFAGSSKLDLIFPGAGTALAIGLSGVLVSAFLASKIQAYNAAGNIGGSFFKGGVGTTGYTGDGNPTEVSQERGRKDYTYHRQEYILPHDVTQEFRYSLLEPLHKKQPQNIKWESAEMRRLLAHAPMPDLTLPDKMASDKRAYVEYTARISMDSLAPKFDGLEARLAAIEGHVGRTADKPDRMIMPDGSIMEITENGSTHLKR